MDVFTGFRPINYTRKQARMNRSGGVAGKAGSKNMFVIPYDVFYRGSMQRGVSEITQM